MARLLIKSTTGSESIELRTGVNLLGRSSFNDFALDHSTVSSAHCEVILSDDGIVIRDLGSTNGTFIEGRRIAQDNLFHGQRLTLGDLEMFLENEVARVAIPQFDARPARLATLLPEGVVGCENHPGFPASERCSKCGRAFCEPCVHELRRVGGAALRLCPCCSSPVMAIASPAPKKVNLFLSFFRRTMRLFTRRLK